MISPAPRFRLLVVMLFAIVASPAAWAVAANDNFGFPIVVAAGGAVDLPGDSTLATFQAGEPRYVFPNGTAGAYKTLWWSWTPTANMRVAISTKGSAFDTVLGVFTGSAVNALTTVVSNDEYVHGDSVSGGRTSRVVFDATAGVTYFIQIDGFGGSSPNTGLIKLHVQPAPSLTIAATTAGYESAAPTNGAFTVSIVNPSKDAFPISFTTSNITATAALDYTVATASPIVLAANATSATIAITVLDDALTEGNEQMRATLVADTANYALGAFTQADLSIVDGEAPRMYVDPDTSGSGNGTTWDNAINDFSDAVSRSANGNEIWVRTGVYKPTTTANRSVGFVMKSGVTWYGGFSGWETSLTQRDWRTRATVLSGDIGTIGAVFDNSFHVVVAQSGSTIDGFVIRDGRDNGSFPDNIGGGLLLHNSSGVSVRNCLITGNTGNFGVAVGAYATNPANLSATFDACVIEGNAASSSGGAIYAESSTAGLTFINCVVANNTASGNHPAIWAINASLAIRNCTFSANIATGAAGGSIFAQGSGNVAFTNSIAWGNRVGTTTPSQIVVSGTTYTAQNSCVEGGVLGVNDGGGNISSDPQFLNAADPNGGDNLSMTADDGLVLNPASACIGAGTATGMPTVDLIGYTRPLRKFHASGFAVHDMGAYERAPIIYVDDDFNATRSGLSWTTAYANLTDALAAATPYANEIWMAKGTYTPNPGLQSNTHQLVAGVPVFGGFAGTVSDVSLSLRDWAANHTTLSGEIGAPGVLSDNSFNVVTGAQRAAIDGLLIIRGYAFGPTYPQHYGGGLMDSNGGTLINNCVFRNNHSQYYGGAIFAYPYCNTTLRNCLFVENTTLSYGGAVAGYYSSVSINHCTFQGNSAPYGGAFLAAYGPSFIRNSIIWGNVNPQVYRLSGTENLLVAGSDIGNSGGSAAWLLATGIDKGGNLDADPAWIDAPDIDGADNQIGTNDDGLRLSTSSPCVNSAVPALDLPSRDLLFAGRPVGPAPDMGCYEGRVGVVAFSSSSSSGFEGTTSPSIPVTLATASDLTVTVAYSVSAASTATPVSDFTLAAGTLTFLPGDTSESIPLQVIADAFQEFHESVVIVLATPANARLGATTSFTYTIRNDDFAGITVSPNINTSTLTTTELAGVTQTASFTVVLTSQPAPGSTVQITFTSLATGEGKLSVGGGAVANSVALTFDTSSGVATSWNTARTVTVTGQDEDIDDGDITYVVQGSTAVSTDPFYTGRKADDVQVKNIDDDDIGILTDVASVATTEILGANHTKVVQVRLRSQPTSNVTVPIAISNGRATVSPASVTFTTIKNDPVSGTTSGWNMYQSITVTGVDNDIDDIAIVPFTVPYSVNFGGASSSDGKYSGLTATVGGSNADEDTAGLTISALSNGGHTKENGGTVTFTVQLASQPLDIVTISPITVDDATEGAVAPASLSFSTAKNVTGGWNLPQTITVTGVDDQVDDGDVSFSVDLPACASTDPMYAGQLAAARTIINDDDDTAAIIFTPASGLITTESGGTATTQVRLATMPSGNVTFTLTSNMPLEGRVFTGALPEADSVTLTFTPSTGALGGWDQPQTVTLVGKNDNNLDGDIPYKLGRGAVTTADAQYLALAADADAVLAINQDNDQPGVNITPTVVTVTEAAGVGNTATFLVRLNTRPAATTTATISLASSLPGLATVSPASVTFNEFDGQALAAGASGWDVAQAVTITGVDDAVDQSGNRSFTIVTAATGTAPGYNGLAVDDVAGTLVDDDVRGILVSPAGGLTTTEAGGVAAFSVVLTSAPSAGTVTIPISTSDATEGRLFSGATQVNSLNLAFTSANWNIPRLVQMVGQNDDLDDGDIPYQALFGTITNPGGDYLGIASPAAVGIFNQDDDVTGVLLSSTSLTLNENNAATTATYTFRLRSQPQPGTSVLVTLALAGQQVTLDTNPDTVGNQSTLTFTTATNAAASNGSSGWNVAQTVTVSVASDEIAEGAHSEQIFHSLAGSDSTYLGLAAPTVAVAITDDTNDSPALLPTPTSGLTVTEATGPGQSANFTMTLRTQPRQNVTVLLASSDPTEGSVPTRLTFTPSKNIAGGWNMPQTVVIDRVDDAIDDNDQSFSITFTTISADSFYNGLTVTPVSVSNIDNDTAGVTYTPAAGATSETGASTTFTVVLDSQPLGDVTIPVAGPALDDEGIASPASLVFTAANWNSAQVVTVVGQPDDVDDGDQNYAVTLGASACPDDAKYAAIQRFTDASTGIPATGSTIAAVSLVNTDIDTAGVTVTPTGGLLVGESSASDGYTVVLNSKPAFDVVITPTADGQLQPLTAMTFTPVNWNQAQTVTVSAFDDSEAEGTVGVPHTGTITHSAASNDPKYRSVAVPPGGTLAGVASVTVLITDNDLAGFLIAPISGLLVEEDGTASAFTVTLTSQPTDDVTFTVTSGAVDEMLVSTLAFSIPAPAVTLTFTAADWNVPQQVTVTGVDDKVDDGNQLVTLTTGIAASNDTHYAGINPVDVSATCVDDDTAGVLIVESAHDVAPAIGLPAKDLNEFFPFEYPGPILATWTYTMVLQSQPLTPVTITINPGLQLLVDTDYTGAIGFPDTAYVNTLVFEPDDLNGRIWSRARTVTVTVVDDVIAEPGSPPGTITHLANGPYTGVSIANVVVSIADNEASTPPVVDLRGPQPNGTNLDLNYVESQDLPPLAAVIDALATVVDADSPDFNTGSLTVQITGNVIAAEDVLGIANGGAGGDITTAIVGAVRTVSYQAAQIGTVVGGSGGAALQVTLTIASKPAVQALVRSLTYTNLSNVPTTTSRTISATLFDGDGGTNAPLATKVVTIAASNDTPIATSTTYYTVTDLSVAGVLPGSDPEGTALQFQVMGLPASGDITLDNATTGAFTYVPDPTFSGSDTFTYRVIDGGGLTSSTVACTLVITGTSDPRPLIVTCPPLENVSVTPQFYNLLIDAGSLTNPAQVTYRVVGAPTGLNVQVTDNAIPASGSTPLQPRARLRLEMLPAIGVSPNILGHHAGFGLLIIDPGPDPVGQPEAGAATFVPLQVLNITVGASG